MNSVHSLQSSRSLLFRRLPPAECNEVQVGLDAIERTYKRSRRGGCVVSSSSGSCYASNSRKLCFFIWKGGIRHTTSQWPMKNSRDSQTKNCQNPRETTAGANSVDMEGTGSIGYILIARTSIVLKQTTVRQLSTRYALVAGGG